MLKSIGGHLRSHGGLVGTEQCKRSFFLNPRACSSGCNRMPKGGIWLGLKSKDLFKFTVKNRVVCWVTGGRRKFQTILYREFLASYV